MLTKLIYGYAEKHTQTECGLGAVIEVVSEQLLFIILIEDTVLKTGTEEQMGQPVPITLMNQNNQRVIWQSQVKQRKCKRKCRH